MAGIFDLPEDTARLLDDEIKGEEEYNAELRQKKANIEDSPFDFDQNIGFNRQASLSKDMDKMDMKDEDVDLRASVLIGSRK
jgi:hypothetical protein